MCSPVLFPLFTHELTKYIVEGGTHGIHLSPELIELLILLFADDIVLCADSVIGLQTQLNVLCDSARRLDLIVNLDKSNNCNISYWWFSRRYPLCHRPAMPQVRYACMYVGD